MTALAKDIASAAAELDKAIANLAKAESDYNAVKALNGQSGYSVHVNGIRVDVANMHPHTYTGTMIRGREMIHLGALKALSAIIEDAKHRVGIERRKLAELSERMARSAS